MRRARGTVFKWKPGATYGWIKPDAPQHRNIFIHESALPDATRNGDRRVGLRLQFDVSYHGTPMDYTKPDAVNVFVLNGGMN